MFGPVRGPFAFTDPLTGERTLLRDPQPGPEFTLTAAPPSASAPAGMFAEAERALGAGMFGRTSLAGSIYPDLFGPRR